MEATDNHQRGSLWCCRASSKLSVAHLGTVRCLELLLLFKLFFGLHWVFAFSSCDTGAQGHAGSVTVARRLCCLAACGIKIPDQGLNLRSLHWKAGS